MATGWLPDKFSSFQRWRGLSNQLYQLIGRLPNGGVHDRDVELLLGRQLKSSRLESALPFFGRFGPPADQPADQFVPARRGQEDEMRVRHRLPDLARALQVDL